MEIKVLCKSDVCLPGHVPDHKGAALYCIQMSSLGKLSSFGKQAQKTILHESLERTLHILERFSYCTHYTSTTAVKVINNPPLIFTHLRCICSKKKKKKCAAKLHKNNTCDEFFILHFLLYATKSAGEDIKAQWPQVCERVSSQTPH